MSPQQPVYFFASVIFLAACLKEPLVNAQLTNEVWKTTLQPVETMKTNSSYATYAWSAWGSWSVCSRTCGGGVAVQERQCLPKEPSRWRRSRKRRRMGSRSLERRQIVTRMPHNEPDCPGIAKRYHECNTAPCPGPPRDHRADQCAIYDRRPFRGRFYTWVPYVDGNSPCTLNCRPRGQHFYASLALVADGTPCTKPGFRAICVQGTCKVVGRESVLAAASSREVRCGRRLVSGLFSRPRLPLGYSHVATVPQGACRLNVSELLPSENYIALRVVNGSYIMNGEFAVSADGAYEAAGARFLYSRAQGKDHVYAHGPLLHPIDIMILYTQPNPSIKYEYLTDTAPDEDGNEISKGYNPPPPMHPPPPPPPVARHQHRHHNSESHTKALDRKRPEAKDLSNAIDGQPETESNSITDRKFTWKILSFTQCSRSCGGGLQIGKFKCVEEGGKSREVSPAHCSGSPPSSRRRRCGTASCPPRWRAAPWGPCPVCGPAHRTRIVGCVQDHARGITKISDQKCPLPVPATTEPCDVPNCDGSSASGDAPRPDARRQVRPGDRTDNFRDSPVYQFAVNTTDNDISAVLGPEYTFSAAGGWLYTDWSECVGWCVGGGVQTRGVRCADPAGCVPRRAPASSQPCTPHHACDPHDGQWFTSEWSSCSAACDGRQTRGAVCLGGSGRRLRDASCRETRPDSERTCGGDCSPAWYLSDWGECEGPCEAGIQKRTVWCARGGVQGAAGAARDSDCPGSRPPARRACVPPRCTTRPAERTAPLAPHDHGSRPPHGPHAPLVPPTISDPQQRVTRHQNSNAHNNNDYGQQTPAIGCADRLSNCNLAVQARLCHYRYYTEYCCRSCHGR